VARQAYSMEGVSAGRFGPSLQFKIEAIFDKTPIEVVEPL